MSEGNLLDQHHQHKQHHHQHRQTHKLFSSSRDSELELLETTTTTPATSSPEIRSRSQSVGSAHREALLFFEQHRLFQNSPEVVDFNKDQQEFDQDCELRSISSCSRNSSPAGRAHQTNGHGHYLASGGNQQQVQRSHHPRYQKKKSNLRQQSDSKLLESSNNSQTLAAGGGGASTNQQNISHSFGEADQRGGRARSQSQGQCGGGGVRRRQDSSESVTTVTTGKKSGDGESGGGGGEPKKTCKWLEEIQFTAQYQHYRTNNYASVVSSASSLDKSDGGGVGGDQLLSSGLKNASEAERGKSSSSSKGASSRHPHQSTKGVEVGGAEAGGGDSQERLPLVGGEQRSTNPADDLNRQNSVTAKQCWNFPRVKLKKLFSAKSLDNILGGGGGGESSRGRSGGKGRKSLQVAAVACAQEEVSGERSSSSPEFVCRSATGSSPHHHTKKAQLLRDNKLYLPRIQQLDDGTQLLIVKPARDGSKSPGAHSSKSAIVISKTAPPSSKQRKVPSLFKDKKSRSFSALTSVLLSRVPGHSHSLSGSGANSPCSSTASSSAAVTSSPSGFNAFFTKRSHQEGKCQPVIPAKKSGHIVPCAKSDNCLNPCAKFVDYFSAEGSASRASKSAASTTTLVEPFQAQQEQYPATPSSSSGVVTAQPRKWTAIKSKWDQKLQASGDRQKEIGASLASVSNNPQFFRKSHHHPTRQRSNSLSPSENPEDGKSIESLLEITSPSPTLQEVRFLDTPEIRYASPVATRSSRVGFYEGEEYEDDNNEDYSEATLVEGVPPPSRSSRNNTIRLVRKKDKNKDKDKDTDSYTSSRPSSAASTCSSHAGSFCSDCSECKENEPGVTFTDEEEAEEMTRHHHRGGAAGQAPAPSSGGGGGGTKRSREHRSGKRHHHHHHHGASGTKEKPKLVVANVTYLQRPMSPGLLLREPSPGSSPASAGTIDSFGNYVGTAGGGASGTDTGGAPTSVIRNNIVFTNSSNINNQYPQQAKSQQAKLEFLKSFSSSSPQQQQQQGFGGGTSRSPLHPSNAAGGNVNERGGGVPGAFSSSISPSSSGGASDNRSSISTNYTVLAHPSASDDLQVDPLRSRQRAFADENRRSGTGDPLIGRGAPFSNDEDNERRRRQPPRYQQHGAPEQPYTMDPFSGHRSHQGASGGGGSSSYEGGREAESRSRTTGNQSSGPDPGNNSGGAPSGTELSSGDPSFSINQNQGPLALAQESNLNNNLYVDVDFEGTDDTMGDLQSPQYVKRTAHMFDSRFSSAENEANGHERNGRNPSYLNVSRSVSGYSCLTYNNGSVASETVNKTMLGNGTSLLTSGSRVSAATPRIKTDFAIHSPFTRNKVPNTDDDSSDHSSNQSATSPPPSLPPINASTPQHGRYSESSFFQNGLSRGEDLLEDTPYIPSHGKSFVMQRIERLYGSDAISNKGVVGRKSSSSNVTTISISRDSPPRGPERIIPIKVEPREDQRNNYNNSIQSSKKIDIHVEDRDGNRRSSGSGGSAGLVLPGIRGRDENVRRVIEHRISRVSVEDSDEEEETVRARHRSPTKTGTPLTLNIDNGSNLNGNANANRYRNGVTTVSLSTCTNGKRSGSEPSPISEDSSSSAKLEQIHANGSNHHTDRSGVDGQICTNMKKALSRESSAESDDTAGCSEASLELGDISDGDSPGSRKNSQDNSLYSSRGGSVSPAKPKPKPKPKDMALLRTLSRSPALKTGNENVDKTGISLSFTEAAAVDPVSKIEDVVGFEDQTDSVGALADIKNTISAAPAKTALPQRKVTPSPPPVDKDTQIDPSQRDKENTPATTDTAAAAAEKVETVTPEFTVKDGNYFINEMKKVTEKILKFSENAAKELDTIDPSEDRAGSIHAAIGKGNLLVKKKFKQFEELCQANLKGATADEPETTNEDLAGFWDMVLIQVDQIYSLFADLENKDIKELEIVPPRTPSAKLSSPKRAPASTSKSTRPAVKAVGATPKLTSEAAKARDEARRKMLAEKRRAMKSQMQETQEPVVVADNGNGQETEVQIFAPETPHTG